MSMSYDDLVLDYRYSSKLSNSNTQIIIIMTKHIQICPDYNQLEHLNFVLILSCVDELCQILPTPPYISKLYYYILIKILIKIRT